MPYNILKLNIEDEIAVVTISRPNAMNALNSEFFTEMNRLLDDIASKNVRAMIITGEGKAFVAGADIAEMVSLDSTGGYCWSKTGHDTFSRIENLPYPVIAAVNGFALGGGCELALACDIRIASTFAKFGQPEVNLGLIPGYAGTQRLPRFIGLSNALYLLMTADMINAEEAYRIGLVQRITQPDQLLPDAMALAKKIASKGQKAVRTVKEVTRRGMLTDFKTASEIEAKAFGDSFGNGESGEGMSAFLEKRNPKW
jgi:enoyl-CoA hydratase